ncbi:MAG: GC-type dockerin domain-anchored protein [Planctomycetota bacterium]
MTPRIVFTINSGLNDRNEQEPSVGPAGVVDGDSAEAYRDNLVALIGRIETLYADRVGDVSELFFLVIPSHPVDEAGSALEAELAGYREAARDFAVSRDRVLVADISQLTSSVEMDQSGWYASDGREHLTFAGYRELGSRVVSEVLFHGCRADQNADGLLDGSDFSAWLDAFLDGGGLAGRADMNGDGTLDSSDFNAWLTGFLAGCDE